MKIAVVDYCKGNLRSVQKGLELAGAEAAITARPEDVLAADAVVLPGVGSFRDAAETMAETGLTEALAEVLRQDKPFLGICLGLHLLFEWGVEDAADGVTPGIGFLKGGCPAMPAEVAGERVKIPHVGWNDVAIVRDTPLFDGIESGSHFYFTHSYCCAPADEADIIGLTTHGAPFASAVNRGNAYGVQFHPEKSSRLGLAMLENFVKIARAAC